MLGFLKWIVVNGAFLAGVIGGVHFGVAAFENLIPFLSTLYALLTLVAVFASCSKDFKYPHPTVYYDAPEWLSQGYDWVIIVFCAMAGWYWTATMWFIVFVCLVIIDDQVKVKAATEKENECKAS